ncbi:TetR/AcrR family transcriptional regulator [Streptococcus cameli]
MCASKRLSAAERKQEIMESAAKRIIEKGFSNTTMEDIIDGTSMSKGGVYHYYKNTLDIFKDIMLAGVCYRNSIIVDHLGEYQKGEEIEFFVKQMVDKVLDDNPYMPLYVEFLIEQKRNPELNSILEELKQVSLDDLKERMDGVSCSMIERSYDLITDVLNGLVFAANILGARENFFANRTVLEQLFILLLQQDKY